MGLFEPERTNSAPHPRKEPRFPEHLSRENLKKVFEGCVDYMERTVYLHGDRKRTVTVCYLLGMARNERLSDYVLRPLAQDPALSQVPEEELFARLQYGALYNLAANRRTALDDVVNDLILEMCIRDSYRAMKLLPRGGYLATASCSHFATEERFVQMLRQAAADAGRQLRQIEARQQAPDHPILWNVEETNYLKFFLFQVV